MVDDFVAAYCQDLPLCDQCWLSASCVAGPWGSNSFVAQCLLHVRQQRHPGATVLLWESHAGNLACQPGPSTSHPHFQCECRNRLHGLPRTGSSLLKGIPSEDTSRPEDRETVQILTFAGFVVVWSLMQWKDFFGLISDSSRCSVQRCSTSSCVVAACKPQLGTDQIINWVKDCCGCCGFYSILIGRACFLEVPFHLGGGVWRTKHFRRYLEDLTFGMLSAWFYFCNACWVLNSTGHSGACYWGLVCEVIASLLPLFLSLALETLLCVSGWSLWLDAVGLLCILHALLFSHCLQLRMWMNLQTILQHIVPLRSPVIR